MEKYVKFKTLLPLGVVDAGLADCEVLEVLVEVFEVAEDSSFLPFLEGSSFVEDSSFPLFLEGSSFPIFLEGSSTQSSVDP